MLPEMKLKKGRISSIENYLSPSSDSESVTEFRIPQELIREILLYVPVKSLGKFKCVSKPWLSLISSSNFIKSHLCTSLKDGHRFNHQLLFTDKVSNYGMKHCSLFSALHNPSTNVVSDIEYPSRNPKSSVQIVGIVNGLVCLFVGRKYLYIWNPILKLSKLLPVSGSSLSCNSFVYHGFGYDESNDDYKVVQVLHVDRGNEAGVKVYSLQGDSWREIEGFKGGLPFSDGTYANGKLWWTTIINFGSGSGSAVCGKIFSLNMASYKYEQVQGPCYEACSYGCRIKSCGGSLYMLSSKGNKADLCVRDENGVENPWSNVFSFGYDDDSDLDHDAMSNFMQKVVCILGNGEIVLEHASGLIVYHTKTKTFRIIQLGGLYIDFSVYVESLVAL